MCLNLPRNNREYLKELVAIKNSGQSVFVWTNHSKMKMRQYRLSEKQVLRIVRRPDRKEEGVALETIAVMQIVGTKKNPKEIWVMYQIINQKPAGAAKKLRIISAWRYPGRTPIGKPPTIPLDVLEELEKLIIL